MAMTSSAAIWLLIIAIPVAVWVAWSDMKFMKIPNKAVLTLTGLWAVVGFFVFPLDVYLWQWAQLLIVLAIGFVIASGGLVGAGDAKFAAAMAPFVAYGDIRAFLMLFAVVMIGAIATHRLARMSPQLRSVTSDWESWTNKDFPMGLALAGALVFYLALAVANGL